MSKIERFCIDLTIGALFVYTKWNEWNNVSDAYFNFMSVFYSEQLCLPNKVSLTANVFTYNT